MEIDVDERHRAEQAVWRQLDELASELRPRVIGAYSALPSELDLGPWLERAAGADTRIALPGLYDNAPRLYVLDPPFAGACRGGLLLQARAEVASAIPIEDVDLILVPGLLFDRRGFRLGRGGGFYDRLLRDHARPRGRCGVCFSHQIVASLPLEAHDVRVGACVSEDGITEFQVLTDA